MDFLHTRTHGLGLQCIWLVLYDPVYAVALRYAINMRQLLLPSNSALYPKLGMLYSVRRVQVY